jgi:hypothetical protein
MTATTPQRPQLLPVLPQQLLPVLPVLPPQHRLLTTSVSGQAG